jgi:hypothetical protein
VEFLPRGLGQEHAVVRAQELRAGVAEEPFRGRIEEGNGPVLADQQQCVRAVLQQLLCETGFHDV